MLGVVLEHRVVEICSDITKLHREVWAAAKTVALARHNDNETISEVGDHTKDLPVPLSFAEQLM